MRGKGLACPGERVEIVFFFKQKAAYEICDGLVGSEMCIGASHRSRDRPRRPRTEARIEQAVPPA